MNITISTTSQNYFTKIQKYLNQKKVVFATSPDNGVYALTIFNPSSIKITPLLNRMVKDLHLTLKSQREPLALAA